MANKDLKRTPHKIAHTDRVWWYEEPAGICLVGAGGQQVTIQWRHIRAALARKDK